MSARGRLFAVLSLVALALTAGAASAAQAQVKLTAGQYPAKLVGTQTSNQIISLEGPRKVECKKLTLEQANFGLTEGEEGMVSLTPTYDECEAEFMSTKYKVSIAPPQCAFTFRAELTAEANTNYTGSVNLSCAGANKMVIQVWEGAVGGTERCKYEAGPQPAGISSVDTEQTGGLMTKTEIGFTLIGFSVNRVAGGLVKCGAATQTTGFTGSFLLTAFNAASVEVGTSIDMA